MYHIRASAGYEFLWVSRLNILVRAFLGGLVDWPVWPSPYYHP